MQGRASTGHSPANVLRYTQGHGRPFYPLPPDFLRLPLPMSCESSATPTPSSDPLGQALASIGRIGVSPIKSPEKMRAVLSGLALDLADLRDQLHREKHPQWWRLADAVDEVLDVYESQFGPLPPAGPAT